MATLLSYSQVKEHCHLTAISQLVINDKTV